MSWISTLVLGLRHVLMGGSPLPDRPTINVVGATAVDNPAKNRTDITIPTPAQAQATLVLVEAIPGGEGNWLVYSAPHDSAVTIKRIDLIPLGFLVPGSDDTDFTIGSAVVIDEGGVSHGGAFSLATDSTGGGGTGDWSVGKPAFTWTPSGGYTLAAGRSLIVGWSPEGAGVDLPAAFWRIS